MGDGQGSRSRLTCNEGPVGSPSLPTSAPDPRQEEKIHERESRRLTRALAVGAMTLGFLVSSGCMMLHHGDTPHAAHEVAHPGPSDAPAASAPEPGPVGQLPEQTQESGHGMMGHHGAWGWIGMGAMMVGMMLLVAL